MFVLSRPTLDGISLVADIPVWTPSITGASGGADKRTTLVLLIITDLSQRPPEDVVMMVYHSVQSTSSPNTRR